MGPLASTARLDAELLMAAALGTTRSQVLLRHMRDPAPAAFEPLLARRLGDEPVAYILGTAEFYGLEFEVSPAVLIPRADSETAIEAARAAFADAPPARLLDCGTGSGALLLTALSLFPKARGTGIDRSAQALAVAQRNAVSLGLDARAAFHHRDWDTPGWSADLGAPFDLILANPPYVEDDAEIEAVVRDFEPHGALFAGPEGLDAYRVLIPQLPALLTGHGLALVEIGSRQAEAVTALGTAAGLAARLHHDLAGRPRIIAFSRLLHR
ncbi:peptide chain release factor N(5)-glutamine methyltransferase [Novosphingobium sp. 1949]|uniref:Release factor glutamine methyltransferase n=2 Tax=Novosphingobium organovorum TaxID=2930092 RepID=A0ABT0B9G8_9SPHN|nr:peptide chain release factor N(5)-glutamine methyltransferase [Novosphingobium organovorum]